MTGRAEDRASPGTAVPPARSIVRSSTRTRHRRRTRRGGGAGGSAGISVTFNSNARARGGDDCQCLHPHATLPRQWTSSKPFSTSSRPHKAAACRPLPSPARRVLAGRRKVGQRPRSRTPGATLFQRGSRGLQLTADGAQYAEACSPLLAQLQAADDGCDRRGSAQGPLVVGGTPFLLQHCIVPALSAFHASYPDLTLDLRAVAPGRDCREGLRPAAVARLVRGRRLGAPRTACDGAGHCSHAGLLEATGLSSPPARPRRPQLPELPQTYGKLLICGVTAREGPQGEVIEEVVVRGWLNSNHRDNLLALALITAA